ncbi:MAG: FAD-dependent oxidoreductase [Thainema sp.]
MPPSIDFPQSSHAVVIGSGIAGLLAARVLTDHVDRVTIVERDRISSAPQARPGTPQSRQIHVLLTQGSRLLEDLFPGLMQDLADVGAPAVDWTADTLWLGPEGWMPRSDSGLTTRTCSRICLEWHLRQRLHQNPRIDWQERTTVKTLLTDTMRSQIVGVQLHHLDSDQDSALATDLVIDASGRNSQLPQWLTELGYTPPEETKINSFLGYSTRWYRIPAAQTQDWKVAMISAKPPHHSRAAILYPVERDQWALLLAGMGGDYPPTDEAGFMEFAQSLRHSAIADMIETADPISPIYAYRRTENRWCHYEALSRFPAGLVALGDSVCAFNPVYGQGMTVAALSARLLGDCLQQHPLNGNQDTKLRSLTKLDRQFRRKLGRLLKEPWMMATSEDFRWPTTVGAQPSGLVRMMHRYLDLLFIAVTDSPRIQRILLEVFHMVKPPTALFQPFIVWRVMKLLLGLQPGRPVNLSPLDARAVKTIPSVDQTPINPEAQLERASALEPSALEQ